MLTLSANARHAVRDVTRRAHLSPQGGLRIAESPERAGAFEVSLAAAPADGDEVVEVDGARVFVEPRTSTLLADQQLDAATSAEGTGFLLAPQD